jgi:leucine-rich repeat protein SHOC2
LDGKYLDSNWLSNFYISEDRDILIWDGWIISQTHTLLDLFDPNIDPKIKVKMFGVDLPRRYWTKFSKWKAVWLLDEENVEVRRLLIQQIGYDRICQELDAIDLDTWREYTLLKIDADIDEEPMVLLKMTCPSTGHIHILRVPPEMTSAEAAITWVNHGIHPDEFTVQT